MLSRAHKKWSVNYDRQIYTWLEYYCIAWYCKLEYKYNYICQLFLYIVFYCLTSLHNPSRLALKQLRISSKSISPFCISTFALEGLMSKQYTKRYFLAKNFSSVRYVIKNRLHCVKFCSLGIADITSRLLKESVWKNIDFAV